MQQLRVLHVIPNLKRGGAERLIVDIVRQIIDSGKAKAQIIVLDASNEYAELTKEIDIYHTRAYYKPSVWRKDNVGVDSFRKFIKTWQPDIIHTHLFQADFIVRMAVGHAYPIVTHFHDNMPQYRPFSRAILRSKKALTNFYERRLIQSTWHRPGNRFIAISKHTEAYLQLALRQNRERVRLIYNAIDLKRFYPTEQSKDISHKVKLINVGSFVPKKNQHFLIEAMEQLPGHFQLLFLGDGPDKKQLEEMVAHKDLADRIQFGGMVHNPEDILREATIYVHAATYEPFGLALVEAMACGLPVVSLDGGGNRDIVDNGVNGYLIEEPDPNHFAQRIKLLVDNPDTYLQLSRGAVQTAQRFGMGAYVNQLMQVYQEAIAEAAALQIAEN